MATHTVANPNTEVVVIGGGYAGVLAANRLTQRDDIRVTLINPRPHFVERIRLHQLVARSGADAEDVLQESWLRWVKVQLDQVRDHRAYLVRITTRLTLDRLRTLQRRREVYVGPWLPKPLLTSSDIAEDAELTESGLNAETPLSRH